MLLAQNFYGKQPQVYGLCVVSLGWFTAVHICNTPYVKYIYYIYTCWYMLQIRCTDQRTSSWVFRTFSQIQISKYWQDLHGVISSLLSVLIVAHHDDIIRWKHFPRYRSLCGEITGHRWISRTTASNAELFICAWTNGCANNRDAGDLRHHCAHYDVTVRCFATHMRSMRHIVNELYCVAIRNNHLLFMMTSSNGNIFRITGHLCGKFTGE